MAPASSAESDYAPEDYITFLVFAAGPVADDHPEITELVLAQYPQLAEVPEDQANSFAEYYISKNSGFAGYYIPKLTSGDPDIVKDAVETFAINFATWIEKEYANLGMTEADMAGCSWGSGCVETWYLALTTAAVGWQVAGLHTAAAVTIAAALAVFVYLPGEAGMNNIDRQEYASSFAVSMAR